ncbi:hypothetical protein [Amycolatopsis sp. NPDC004378]
MTDAPPETEPLPGDAAATRVGGDVVDEWGKQSFPASDPPANWRAFGPECKLIYVRSHKKDRNLHVGARYPRWLGLDAPLDRRPLRRSD